MSSEARIALAKGAEDVGLATMLADLIRQNLAQHPRKWVDFNKLDAVIAIDVSDAGVCVALAFSRGALAIRAGCDGSAAIRIVTSAESVLALCTLRIARGIPMLFDQRGCRMLKSLFSGELKISGIPRHPVQLVRFTRLMSVNESGT